MRFFAEVLIVAGSILTLIGGIGVIRFRDALSRMHAAAKAPTLGLILVALGATIELSSATASATLFLVVVLQLLTTPVGSHMVGRAAHGKVELNLDGGDALAERRRLEGDADVPEPD